MNKKLGIFLLFIAALITLALVWKPKTEHKAVKGINSFEECVAAGYPVMESYPEQCNTPDGKHFVKSIIENK